MRTDSNSKLLVFEKDSSSCPRIRPTTVVPGRHGDFKSLASKRSIYYLFAAIQNLPRNVLWAKR
jgi:hypothetical protein